LDHPRHQHDEHDERRDEKDAEHRFLVAHAETVGAWLDDSARATEVRQ
jgi:hypothetical protein